MPSENTATNMLYSWTAACYKQGIRDAVMMGGSDAYVMTILTLISEEQILDNLELNEWPIR
jgi:hypothetical protein